MEPYWILKIFLQASLAFSNNTYEKIQRQIFKKIVNYENIDIMEYICISFMQNCYYSNRYSWQNKILTWILEDLNDAKLLTKILEYALHKIRVEPQQDNFLLNLCYEITKKIEPKDFSGDILMTSMRLLNTKHLKFLDLVDKILEKTYDQSILNKAFINSIGNVNNGNYYFNLALGLIDKSIKNYSAFCKIIKGKSYKETDDITYTCQQLLPLLNPFFEKREELSNIFADSKHAQLFRLFSDQKKPTKDLFSIECTQILKMFNESFELDKEESINSFNVIFGNIEYVDSSLMKNLIEFSDKIIGSCLYLENFLMKILRQEYASRNICQDILVFMKDKLTSEEHLKKILEFCFEEVECGHEHFSFYDTANYLMPKIKDNSFLFSLLKKSLNKVYYNSESLALTLKIISLIPNTEVDCLLEVLLQNAMDTDGYNRYLKESEKIACALIQKIDTYDNKLELAFRIAISLDTTEHIKKDKNVRSKNVALTIIDKFSKFKEFAPNIEDDSTLVSKGDLFCEEMLHLLEQRCKDNNWTPRNKYYSRDYEEIIAKLLELHSFFHKSIQDKLIIDAEMESVCPKEKYLLEKLCLSHYKFGDIEYVNRIFRNIMHSPTTPSSMGYLCLVAILITYVKDDFKCHLVLSDLYSDYEIYSKLIKYLTKFVARSFEPTNNVENHFFSFEKKLYIYKGIEKTDSYEDLSKIFFTFVKEEEMKCPSKGKEAYLQFLLHINENFDDDLLYDVVEMIDYSK